MYRVLSVVQMCAIGWGNILKTEIDSFEKRASHFVAFYGLAFSDQRRPRVESRHLEDWMTRRLLESLSGVGAIHAGELLLRTTSYELRLWSDDQPPSSGEDPKPSIDGHIDTTGIAEALVLAGAGTLTLTIEDGRRMAFQLTSSAGAIVGRGWLP